MNKILAIAAIALLSFGLISQMTGTEQPNHPGQVELTEFQIWKAIHGKTYASLEEEHYRMRIFLNTKLFVELENAKNNGVEHELNSFADLTKEEFVAIYLGFQQSAPVDESVETFYHDGGDLPAAYNWVQLNDVAPIQNQGQCGSCWSFSAAEAVESAYAVFKNQNNPVPVLSEEQLVQCAGVTNGYTNFGCQGGQMTEAFRYIKQTPLNTGAAYPYTSGTTKVAGPCNKAAASAGTYGIQGYKNVGNQLSDLEAAVYQQPISVAVDATNWSSYKSGTFTNCGTQLNHGVLAVGYDENQYWLIKNSWGTTWGQAGYIQVGWDEGQNCGINMSASFPTL